MQDLEPAAPAAPKGGGPAGPEPVLESGAEVQIRRGVAEDRVVSVSDPAMRRGHKSAQCGWEGYQAHVAAETGHEFITAVSVTGANAYDGDQAPALLAAQQALGLAPAALVGDRAYRKAEVRRAARALGSDMVARVAPAASLGGLFSKDAFTLDLQTMQVTCPAGVTTRTWRWKRYHGERGREFTIAGAVCAACALRERGTPKAPEQMRQTGMGRSISLHPLEAILEEARTAEQTPRVKALLRLRPLIERRIAHLMRVGLREARYRGRAKVEFQAVASALVVNLRRLGTLLRADPILRERWSGAAALARA